jgi:hypothetical protein
MTIWDAIGFGASALVLLAFYQRRMIPLRVAALGSNVAFIAYGFALGLAPVWLLHAVLLPVNVKRLSEAVCSRHSLDGGRQAVADPVSGQVRLGRMPPGSHVFD